MQHNKGINSFDSFAKDQRARNNAEDNKNDDDAINDSQSFSSGIMPMMMMSQDCVVWNECNSSDLRSHILSMEKSRNHHQHQPHQRSTNNNAALPTSPASAGLQGHGATAVVTDEYHAQKSHHPNKKRRFTMGGQQQVPEREIETLFCLLKNNPDGDQQNRVIPTGPNNLQGGNSHESEFPTPLHRNNNRQQVLSTATGNGAQQYRNRHSFPPSKKVAAMPTKNGQNRSNQSNNNSSNNNNGSIVASGNHNISPVPMQGTERSSNLPRRNPASNTLPRGMSDFEDLLNQVETPSPHLTSSNLTALLPAASQQPQGQQQLQQQEQQSQPSNSSINRTKSSDTVTNRINDSGHGIREQQQHPHHQKHPDASEKAIKIRPKVLNDQAFEKENLRANSSTRINSKYLPGQQQQNALTGPAKPFAFHNTEKPNNLANTKSLSQQTTQPVPDNYFMESRSTPMIPTNRAEQAYNKPEAKSSIIDNDDDSDEFGGFDLSEEDFAQVDSLVAATQAQQLTQEAQAAPVILHPASFGLPSSGPLPAQLKSCVSNNGAVSSSLVAKNSVEIKPEITVKAIEADSNFDDQFGDFPDIDFDELDAAIVNHQTQSHSSCAQPMLVHGNNNINNTPATCTVRNPRSKSTNDETSYLSFTRYRVQRVETDMVTYTKRLRVKLWDSSMQDDYEKKVLHKTSNMGKARDKQPLNEDDHNNLGLIILRGSWYYLGVEDGDVIHLVSLTGRFMTDPSALPVILDTNPPAGSDYDDLVPIVHPDMLAIPTTITETMDCARRAVLKSRLGSKVSTSKALLLGTMRHSLFEFALKARDTTKDAVRHQIGRIIRGEAEKLVGCRMSSVEAERELWKFWPQVETFKRRYFNDTPSHDSHFQRLEGAGGAFSVPFRFAATAIKGVEEEVSTPELGLKGNLDVLVEAMAVPSSEFANWLNNGGPHSSGAKSLVSIELKTHHNSNPQNKHFAQLAFYTVMLLSRYGHTASVGFKRNPKAFDAIAGSMLLYINPESMNAMHVAPNLDDIKTLIEYRNTFCSASKRASRPRGVTLTFENEESEPEVILSDPPPADLPQLQAPNMCSRCYSARECMVYAAAGSQARAHNNNVGILDSHSDVLGQYTSHLREEELAYFRTWDRLIDLEADATQHSVAEAWLEGSKIRENSTGKCISSLVYQPLSSQIADRTDDGSLALITMKRSRNSNLRTPLSSLHLQKGCYVACSTDTTTTTSGSPGSNPEADKRQHPFRHRLKVLRATVERIEDDAIILRTSLNNVQKLEDLLVQFYKSRTLVDSPEPSELTFRLDSDDSYSQMGTLRMNLIDFLTKDKTKGENAKADPKLLPVWMQRRYERLRELIIQLQMPVFDQAKIESMFNPPSRARSIPGCDPMDLATDFHSLNADQKAAAQKVASMIDYTLIQGLPGSGKTSTICFMARMLAAQGKRVLITSYTHSAVDNCLLKLVESNVSAVDGHNRLPAVVRLGEKTSVHPNVQPLLVSEIAADLEGTGGDSLPTAESLRRVVGAAQIIGATVLKIPKSPLLLAEHFDVVIVDEAGQITQPALLGALTAANSFVLVGDHMQLPPLVSSECALAGGYGDSMLKRLAEAHPDAVVQLKLQFRMHQEICSLASNAVYSGNLKCAIDIPRLTLPGYPKAVPLQGVSGPWLKNVVNPYRPVVFADTDRMGKKDGNVTAAEAQEPDAIVPLERTASRQTGGNLVNDTEAELVSLIVQAIVASGLPPSSIGIISPFNAQIRLLESLPQLSKLKSDGLEMSTIDKYQGRDKQAIIVSFVRSNTKGNVGRLLQDIRRINVAITRAKNKMILVGSFSTLHKGSTTLKGILDQIQHLKRVESLPPNAIVKQRQRY